MKRIEIVGAHQTSTYETPHWYSPIERVVHKTLEEDINEKVNARPTARLVNVDLSPSFGAYLVFEYDNI
jgi:hypothetical protein